MERRLSRRNACSKRVQFLLELRKAMGSQALPAVLQQAAFVCEMNMPSGLYEFVPGNFGAYSFQLEKDLALLDKVQNCHSGLHTEGKFPFKEVLFNESKRCFNFLLKETYLKYPYYAIGFTNSEVLFTASERRVIEAYKEERKAGNKTLYTIGYEGQIIDRFINELLKHDIRLLVDVRKNAISRKHGFSKNRLKNCLAVVGVDYLHLSDLGIESAKRKNLDSEQDYRQLFAEYEKYLETCCDLIEFLNDKAQSEERIGLMCFEKDSQMCHRHVLRDRMLSARSMESKDL